MQLILGDCLEIMPTLADKSVDMILCDLPYGTTACKWDTVIPFEPLWKEYKRLIKDRGAIVLTASQPFTSALVMSNPKMFRHEWIWVKDKGGNFANCSFSPMKIHEHILIFGKGKASYNPQMEQRPTENKRINGPRLAKSNQTGSTWYNMKDKGNEDVKFPTSVKYYNSCREYLHPTQKPVALFEYLIRTYTNEGDTVLDNCAGSGTTGVACLNTGRDFILIEKDADYFKIIQKRIAEAGAQMTLTEGT